MRRPFDRETLKSVFARDRGICQHCKADCEKVGRVYWSIRDTEGQFFYGKLLGFTERSRFWAIDHIIEVAMGGDNDLENLQTLCLNCHKRKTAVFVVAFTNAFYKCNVHCENQAHINHIIAMIQERNIRILPTHDDAINPEFQRDEDGDYFYKHLGHAVITHWQGVADYFHGAWNSDPEVINVESVQ